MAQKFLNGIDVSSTTVINGDNLSNGSTVLDVQGSQGQLFSVTNSLTGDLFSVSDISGVPILNVNSSGSVNVDGSFTVNGSITTVGGNIIAGGAVYPASNASASLGLSTKQWAGLDLSSSSAITWGNGDAEIIEGETNNYSLTFKTYDGTNNSAALRLDGDNTATFTGSVTATQFKLNNNVTNTNADSFFVYSNGGSTAYGMTLWNTSGASGEWATMIFGPNQTSRRISFGKANANFGTNHAGIDELAYIDLDNGNFYADGTVEANGATFTGDLDVTRSSTGQILSRVYNSNTSGTGTSVLRIANGGNQANGARLEFSDLNYYNATISVDRTNGMRFMVHDDSNSMADLLTHPVLTLATNKAATFAGEISQIYNPGNTGAFQYLKNVNSGDAAYVSKKWQNDDAGFGEIWRNSSTRNSGVGNTVSSFNMYNSAAINFWPGGSLGLTLDASQNATFAGDVSITEKLIHSGDANTYIQFPGTNDKIVFATNGVDRLTLDAANVATFAGDIVMGSGKTVDGVDISALPTSFAPTNAEQNVQPDWNATSGDAQILNKLNREFKQGYWGDDRFVRVVTGTGVGGADTGDKWVHLSNVDIGSAYEKVKIEFTIGSYDDNARGDERIAVLYENHSSAQEGHILHWYKGDQIPTLFKAVKSIRSANSGLSNTYDLYVQIDGAWKDSFTVHAEWWKTHTTAGIITYPTTVGGSTPTAGSDDKSLTSRERWIDADMLDGYHLSTTRNSANTVPVRDANGYLNLGWINTTSGVTTATINKIYVSDDNYIRYITPATFRTDIINDYYLPIGGGTLTGNLKVVGSIESRKNIVSNNNYNIVKISSTRTTDDYGGLNKTYAELNVQTPGPNTDGTSSAHGLGHLSIKLADNAGNNDLVQKALLRHDGELILGGFYPQTSETELAGLTIRSRYAGSNRNFLRFQTDHSTATTEWTMGKIYAGDGGNFNGKLYFQVATGSNASTAYDSGHDAQLETALTIDDTKDAIFSKNIYLDGANPYIKGRGTGGMRIKHTAGQTMYIRPDETGALSFFEGADSQSVYFMTQTPTVNNTTNESAQLKFHTRSKQSDGNAVSKYATIKHLTHSIGYNYTTLDFSGSDKAKFNMPLEAAGGLYFTGDTHMGFIPHPIGAQYRSDSSTDTGYILIKLPTDVGTTPDDMVSFYVDIYDYTTNEMISVFVGGYTYRTTSTSVYWYNCTAIINTKLAAKDFNVRFGYDGTNYYVAIGETDSVWSHPSIVVRDFQCSYRGNVESYIDGWAISTETGTLSGVDETQTGNLPAASSAAWDNITSRPYIVNASNNSATATTTIANVAHATYTAAFFDFVIKNGTNVRSGTVYACHDGASTPLVEFAETSTVDLGDTSDVTLSVDISGANMRLRATTTSSTWTIKSLIRAI